MEQEVDMKAAEEVKDSERRSADASLPLTKFDEKTSPTASGSIEESINIEKSRTETTVAKEEEGQPEISATNEAVSSTENKSSPNEDVIVQPSAEIGNTDTVHAKEESSAPAQIEKKKYRREDVEAMALDFIANNVHHPVVSCYRELRRRDINLIFNQIRFRTHADELEQAILCITLMDYIATSLNNPLYSESFLKSQFSVRPYITVIFTELRRVLKDWTLSNPSTFLDGKRMVVKYLQTLSVYFKEIQYEKSFVSAVNFLERDASRAYREASKAQSKAVQLPGTNLHEAPANAVPVKDVIEEDGLGDNFFDFLDDVPSRPKPTTTPLQSKAKEKNASGFRNYFTSTPGKPPSVSSPRLGSDNGSTKRSASDELDKGFTKKVCLSVQDSVSPAALNGTANDSKVSSTMTSRDSKGVTGEVKEKGKVNAFIFLMNRSKELAKANKAKKQNTPVAAASVSKIVHTVE